MARYLIVKSEGKRTPKDKPYLRAKIEGDGWASIWHAGTIKALHGRENVLVEGELEVKGDFMNLKNVEIVAEGGKAGSTTRTSAARPPEESRSIVREAIIKAGAQALPYLISADASVERRLQVLGYYMDEMERWHDRPEGQFKTVGEMHEDQDMDVEPMMRTEFSPEPGSADDEIPF